MGRKMGGRVKKRTTLKEGRWEVEYERVGKKDW